MLRWRPAQRQLRQSAAYYIIGAFNKVTLLKFIKLLASQMVWEMLGEYRYTNRIKGEKKMFNLVRRMWSDDEGQDIAEYAVMLAVILVIVVGTIKLIGTEANTVFSETASSMQ